METMMKVIVKAAHCIRKNVYKRRVICQTLKKSVLSKHLQPSVKVLAFDALCVKEDFEYWNDDVVHENVFDAIYPLCTENDRRALMRSLLHSRTLEEFRSEVFLSVEPCMKVGAFKSSLKAKPWIPEDRLLLVREEGSCPLEDDSSTLDAYGIEDGDSILVCMDGSFPVTVVDFDSLYDEKSVVDIDSLYDEEFAIPISSCFETIGDLKKKIHKKTGKDPDDLSMLHHNISISENDDTLLIAHGIVKQYWNMQQEITEKDDMPNRILMVSESHYSKHCTNAIRNILEHAREREHEER